MTTTTMITIDCQTCPARGRLCGDCFVPVLGRGWVADGAGHQAPARQEPALPPSRPTAAPVPVALTAPLDSDELAAVSAFVRAGLVDPEEAALARAELGAGRQAAG